MNRIYLVHCWEGTINDGWYPWLKEQLEKDNNNTVYMENMPNTESPVIQEWVNKLDKQVRELGENTYFIGHSIGCQTILRYLEAKGVGKIGGIVLVAPWLELLPAAIEDEESRKIAIPWLDTSINFDKIRNMTNNITCIFSDNDYWVSIKQMETFEKLLNANTVVLHNKGHISEEDGVMSSQEILEEVNNMFKNK